MKVVFRLFFVSFLIPLISVGLCATGKGKHRVHRTVLISEEGSLRKLQNADTNSNSSINFPPSSGPSSSGSVEPRAKISLVSETTDSLPVHPHPLNIDIKSIKNSTRIDESSLIFDASEARHYPEWWFIGFFEWALGFVWKLVSSYLFYVIANTIFGTLWKKVGWTGPVWKFKTTLGKKGDDDHGGHQGSGSHGQMGQGHSGWGQGGLSHGGWGGYHPHHSFDNTLAMPYVNKKSLKNAKKAAKYIKKAQKYANKASKFAAKAHVLRLQVAPYTAGWAPPGLPPYGAGELGQAFHPGGWRSLGENRKLGKEKTLVEDNKFKNGTETEIKDKKEE